MNTAHAAWIESRSNELLIRHQQDIYSLKYRFGTFAATVPKA